ncbi:unnamed protein product (macronuclear) [Paramecium tetraurelia]|uniref:Protein kinase domain-containing protein n=1 Tax=Paramecium tetraurelia TaxID=5888 RepID=A0BN81_PARTE|nr:uncharacterized protein GSPATT00030636001 [Paramecium tetraurelia]CAK59998.1 unnamed protein product [Paramecium tetraurelia]|eukprot:XP_001427396.1 hypothetical protein (macronuclear) [Paramecium tetraurelia strain d4-2]
MLRLEQQQQVTFQPTPEILYHQEFEQPHETAMYMSLNYHKANQQIYSQANQFSQHSKLFDLRKKYLKNREDTQRRSVSHHSRVPTNRSPLKTQQTQKQFSPKQENTLAQQKKKTTPVSKNLGSNLRNILKTTYAQQTIYEENPQNENIRKEYSQIVEIPPEYQSINSYTFIKTLGIGATAEVKMARHKELEIDVAIKIYDKKKMNNMHLKNLEREVEILNQLKHPNIINLYHMFENDKSIYLSMEYSSPSNLEMFMKGRPFKRINEDEAKILFRQISNAVSYMHEQDICHRDLKFENLLIDYTTKKIKLIDFGYSIKINGKQTCSCGTPQYMAPELVKKSSYDQSVDVWACGVILYKIVTGVFPFRGNSEKDLSKKICLGKIEYPSFVSFQAKQLISAMLKVDSKERITMKEVQQSPWLQ